MKTLRPACRIYAPIGKLSALSSPQTRHCGSKAERAGASRVFSANPIAGKEMTANVSIWLRAFRPPLQRAYTLPHETDRALADLLRKADERIQRNAPASAGASRGR